ncbi:hypothetical protein [Brachybacterium huguangmaarense]
MDDELEQYTPMTAAGRHAAALLEIPDEEAAYGVLSACTQYIARLEGHDALNIDARKGTRLARVDAALRPYELSAAVKRSLSASHDHLHTLMTLLTKGEAQHTFAPFTIIRGSIEAASQGLYGIGPRNTSTMIQRSLHLEYSNVRNSHRFRQAFSEIDPNDKRLARLEDRAEASGLAVKSLKERLSYSHVIGTVDKEHGASGMNTAIWQLTSGIAHNWSWASIALTDREEIEGTRDDIGASFRVTSNTTWLATCVRTACILHEILRVTHERRSLGISYRREALQAEALMAVMGA